MPIVEIFRSGKHTAMNGTTYEYTDEDLRQMATAYSPQRKPAVLTIGHPADDQPDLGTVDKLVAQGGRLFAHFASVSQRAIDLVRGKFYRNVSASFMPPYHPKNPVPGTWYLKHVGMLGAAAPAVKGMAELAFSAGPQGCVSFAEYDHSGAMFAGLVAGSGAAFSASPGSHAAPDAMVDYQRAVELASASGMSFLDAAIAIEKGSPAAVQQGVSYSQSAGMAAFSAPQGHSVEPAALSDYHRAVEFAQTSGVSLLEAAIALERGSSAAVQRGVSYSGQPAGVASFSAPPGSTADPAGLAVYEQAVELAKRKGIDLVSAILAILREQENAAPA